MPALDSQAILLAILGGTFIGSVLTFLNTRRANRTAYMESVADTLSEWNDKLKKEVHDLREEAKELRAESNQLRIELEKEQMLRRRLEARIAVIEDRTDL